MVADFAARWCRQDRFTLMWYRRHIVVFKLILRVYVCDVYGRLEMENTPSSSSGEDGEWVSVCAICVVCAVWGYFKMDGVSSSSGGKLRADNALYAKWEEGFHSGPEGGGRHVVVCRGILRVVDVWAVNVLYAEGLRWKAHRHLQGEFASDCMRCMRMVLGRKTHRRLQVKIASACMRCMQMISYGTCMSCRFQL